MSTMLLVQMIQCEWRQLTTKSSNIWTRRYVYNSEFHGSINKQQRSKVIDVSYGNTGCGIFRRGIQNQKDFCLRINILKENYPILRIGLMGRCQNLTFKVNFLHQKLSESFSFFFSFKNINLGAHFLLMTFFVGIKF